MKRAVLLTGVVLSCALAACGGGNSGVTPTPIVKPSPTQTPATQSRVHWTLIDAQGTQSVAPASRRPSAVGFVQNSLMAITCQQCPATPYINNNPAVSPIDVTPSPSPGVSPSPAAVPTFTITAPGSGLTPLPGGSYPVGYGIVKDGTTWTVNGIATPGMYSLTATYPNGDSGTIPVAAYATFGIAAGWTPLNPQYQLTTGWNFTTNTPTNDTTQADVYWTSDGILHFPYGAVLLPFSTPIGSVSVTQWSSANALTTVDRSKDLISIPLFKTSSGSFVKVFPEDSAQLGPYWLDGGYSVAPVGSDFPY